MKVGVSCLLGFGLLAAAVALTKTVQLTNLAHHGEGMDTTFFVARLALATLAEAWIVMAVGCIPTLRPLMKAAMRRLRGTSAAKQRTPFYDLDKYGMPSVPRGTTRSDVPRASSRGKRQSTRRGSGRGTIELYSIDDRGSKETCRCEMGLVRELGTKVVVITDVDASYMYGRRRGINEEDQAEKQAEGRIRGFAHI